MSIGTNVSIYQVHYLPIGIDIVILEQARILCAANVRGHATVMLVLIRISARLLPAVTGPRKKATTVQIGNTTVAAMSLTALRLKTP